MNACLALPSRRVLRRDHLLGATLHASTKRHVEPMTAHSSLINHCFNILWAGLHNALESGQEFDWWAIAHDDIELAPGWLESLIEVAEEEDADFVSSYVAIKDHRGTVSAGVHNGDVFDIRRFTVRELAEMPESFSDRDVDGKLVLNTGCCVLRLRGPWVERPQDFLFDDKVRMVRNSAGEWKAQCFSEDWLFTDKIREAGGKLVSTRRVSTAHEGGHLYRNDAIWGSWATDEAYKLRHANEDQVSPQLQLSAKRCEQVAGV